MLKACSQGQICRNDFDPSNKDKSLENLKYQLALTMGSSTKRIVSPLFDLKSSDQIIFTSVRVVKLELSIFQSISDILSSTRIAELEEEQAYNFDFELQEDVHFFPGEQDSSFIKQVRVIQNQSRVKIVYRETQLNNVVMIFELICFLGAANFVVFLVIQALTNRFDIITQFQRDLSSFN
jgi:hypothetical protein